jgi:peptidoglycan/LPS O-acetylase OafA/YrhL
MTASNNRLWQVMGRFSKQIRVLGLATYPLYLIHYDLIDLIARMTELRGIIFVAMCFMVAILVAVGIVQFVEPPLKSAIRWTTATALKATAENLRVRVFPAR